MTHQLPPSFQCDSHGISRDVLRNRNNRLSNLISIAIPLAGTILAVCYLPYAAPSQLTISLFLIFTFLSAIGVGVGLHRYFTHRAFKTSRLGKLLLGIFGAWCFQGPLSRWVADHRRHHRFTDRPYDTHSPYWIEDVPVSSKFKGWFHSHFLWMLTGCVSHERRYSPDNLADPISSWCTKYYWPLAVSSLLLPGLLAFIVSPTNWRTEAVLAFFWAGCVRVTLLHQLTWSVNSIGHMFGSKVAGSSDESRNVLSLTVLLLGEGLHSYHHKWPSTAINRPIFLDLMGVIILFMAWLGLVWDVRDPNKSQISELPSTPLP